MSDDGIIALLPGACFHDRYRVVRRIKAGGMGAVYEVVDDRTNSRRALKVMLPDLFADADLQARFALEAKITGDIVSDHLVRVSDAGIDPVTGTPFLVMELLLGEDLGRHLRTHRPLPKDEVVIFLHQAALALDKTHAAGIVHRDLKPDNLFLTYRDDGSPCIKILDFGVAKIVAQGAAGATRTVGTPLYMAPEQVLGEATVGPRADLFALGHIAYTMLVGEPYWIEEQRSVDSIYPLLSKIAQGMPEAPSARAKRRRGVAVPPGFDAWLATAAARRPENRFDRATAQIAALAEALGVSGPMAPAPSISAALRGPAPAPVAEPVTIRETPRPLPTPSPTSVPAQVATVAGLVTTAATPRARTRSRPRAMMPLLLGGAVGAMLTAATVVAVWLRHDGGGSPAPGASAPASVEPLRAVPSSAPLPPPSAVAPPVTAQPEPTATVAVAAPVRAATTAEPSKLPAPARGPVRPRGAPAPNAPRPSPSPNPLADGPGF